MRRLLMVSAVAAMMAAMMAVTAAPAMAIDLDFKDHDNDFDNHDFDNHNFNNFHNFNGNNGFFNGGVDQESESGDLENNFEVSNTGDYAFQCTPAIQFGNTGNFNNGSSFVQGFSEADDFEPDGIEFSFDADQNTDCSNTIQQSSAADSSWSSWW